MSRRRKRTLFIMITRPCGSGDWCLPWSSSPSASSSSSVADASAVSARSPGPRATRKHRWRTSSLRTQSPRKRRTEAALAAEPGGSRLDLQMQTPTLKKTSLASSSSFPRSPGPASPRTPTP